MMIRPNILLEFEGFTNQELTTIYLKGTHRSDTLFGFVDTSSRTAMIHWSQVPSVWNVQSDSMDWEEDIVVYEWDAKESNTCHCFIEGTVKLEYGGNFYNFHYEDAIDAKNHPLIIKK
jgi:hypothetical protein